jgi:hypothetical protein
MGVEPGWGDIMPVQSRYWLDYDAIALAVLVIGISIVELLVLCI